MWIPVDQSLRTNPKLAALAAALGVHKNEIIGVLVQIWWFAVDHAPKGNLAKFGNAVLADAAAWKGDPDTLRAALRETGWESERGDLSGWDSYAGVSIDRRRTERERKRKQRVSGTSRGRPADSPGTPVGTDSKNGGTSRGTEAVKGKEIEERRGEESVRPPDDALPPPKDPSGVGEELGTIPCLEEVVSEGALRNIPPGFCEFFRDKTTANRAWFTRHGQPRDWRADLRAWWLRDQANWREPKGAAASGRSSTEIEAELKATPVTDKPRRAELIAELEAARHREKGNPK